MPAVPAIDIVARRCAVVLAASALLPLAGCSSSPDDGAAPGTRSAAFDVPAAPRHQIASGGTLRWAVDRAPRTLNAYQPDADATTDRIAGATLPALFTLDGHARPRLNPDYLEAAEVTAREPRQTVVYKLNPKARWSDGKKIGVRDFVAQWKALNGRDSAYWAARNAGYDRIAKITKGAQSGEVRVTFARPYADWPSLFTPLYPRGVTQDPDVFNEGSRTRLPAGAGPFLLKGVDKGRATTTLVRNPVWWGERAKLDRIQLKAVPRGERQAQLAAGELDLAEIDAPVAERVGNANEAWKNGEQGRNARAAAVPRGTDDKAPVPLGPLAPAGPVAPAKNGEAAPSGAPPGVPSGAPSAPSAPAPMGAVLARPGLTTVTTRDAAASLHRWADARLPEKERRKARAQERERLAQERAAARARAAERRQLRGYTVRKALDPAYTQLALNGASGPLADQRVRRAVARAVDREDLAEQVLGRAGLPVEPLGSHLRMRSQHGYRDTSGALGGTDQDSARQLLADAGWRGGEAAPAGGKQEQAVPDSKPERDPAQAGGPEKPGGAVRGGADPQHAEQRSLAEARRAREAREVRERARRNAAEQARKRAAERAEAEAAQPRHRAEVERATVRLSAAETARVTGRPLSPAAPAAGQRAALLAQAARAELRQAREDDSARGIRRAKAALRAAAGVRATADELRMLSAGEATAVRTKAGRPLALRFVVPGGPGSERLRETGERIASALNGIGVRTQIKKVAEDDYFKEHVAAGDYDLALYSWPASAYPATDARPIHAKPEVAPDGSLLVEQNYTRVGTDQIDQLFKWAAGELDDRRRNKLLEQADARIWAAAGTVPLYQRPQLTAAKDKLVNAGAFGFLTPRYQDIGYHR